MTIFSILVDSVARINLAKVQMQNMEEQFMKIQNIIATNLLPCLIQDGI